MPSFRRAVPSVYVGDFARAIAFYRDALGFTLECIDDPPARAVVTNGSAVLHLDLDATRAGTSRVHMLVDDLDAVAAQLERANATILQPPTVQPWGLREMIVADANGNELELAQPSGIETR